MVCAELLAVIDRLNHDDAVDGILVQLPLPKHLSSELVIAAISPEKDVDGFHVVSAGSLLTGRTGFRPCTPYGVMKLLEEAGCDPAGKHAVVGKPQALMLLEKNASVTIVHSRTTDLAEHTRRADILVAAVGRAKMVKADMVKPGAVVIDVGMNRDENGKLCGDVDYENVREVASAITPVPGGVGPSRRSNAASVSDDRETHRHDRIRQSPAQCVGPDRLRLRPSRARGPRRRDALEES